MWRRRGGLALAPGIEHEDNWLPDWRALLPMVAESMPAFEAGEPAGALDMPFATVWLEP